MTSTAVVGRGGTRGRVVDDLRTQIVEGTLLPGTPLRVEALMRSLGVSNSPLREAFVQLQSEGLVSVAPNRGAVVTPLTRNDATDLIAVLGVLWDAVTRWTVPVLDGESIESMKRLRADLTLALRGGDLPNGVLCAEAFESELLGACWSTELVRSLDTVRPRQRRLLRACASPRLLQAHLGLQSAVLADAGTSDFSAASAAWRTVWTALDLVAQEVLPGSAG